MAAQGAAASCFKTSRRVTRGGASEVFASGRLPRALRRAVGKDFCRRQVGDSDSNGRTAFLLRSMQSIEFFAKNSFVALFRKIHLCRNFSLFLLSSFLDKFSLPKKTKRPTKMKNTYIEITNICNLNCSFCPSHSRKPRFMSVSDFSAVTEKIDGKTDNIFLHVMGEPLLHPELDAILRILDGMKGHHTVKITTNGVLLPKALPLLLDSKRLKTLCISLHSFEANRKDGGLDKYLSNCLDAAENLAEKDKFAVLRLWNEGGLDSLNTQILKGIEEKFPKEGWEQTRRGLRVGRHVFVELGEKFNWPLSYMEALPAERSRDTELFEPLDTDCHALLHQYAILADGTVVPCCLDRNGDIPLGNILDKDTSIEDILSSPRAKKMRDEMASHRVCEKLCITCGKRKGAFQK